MMDLEIDLDGRFLPFFFFLLLFTSHHTKVRSLDDFIEDFLIKQVRVAEGG